MIEKAKELDLLYCYEIENENKDLLNFYNKIFSDILFKFQFSTPELFERAKAYGKELVVNRFPKKS